MTKNIKTIFAAFLIVLAGIVIALGIYEFYSGARSPQETKNEQGSQIQPELNDETIEQLGAMMPAGWYTHRDDVNIATFTPQENPPDPDTTYSEYIRINVHRFDAPTPEEWNFLKWTNDETIIHEKEWTTLGGLRTLRVSVRVEHLGGELIYYLFSDDSAHIFNLYPIETSDNIELFENIVRDYAEQLGAQ